MRIALAQLNPIVGDIENNLALLEQTLVQVSAERPDLVVFPELFLVGYPPLDLLERGWFIARQGEALEQVARISRKFSKTGILLGAAVRTGLAIGKPLYNAAVLFLGGNRLLSQPKTLLPTYDVFDELRYFEPAPCIQTVRLGNEILGISVCEDAWNGPPGNNDRSPIADDRFRRPYDRNPVAELAEAGASLLVTIAASPFWIGKEELRYSLISSHARRHGLPFVFLNQVGANDELVFDGRSMALDAQGEPILVMEPFTEQVAIVDTTAKGRPENFRPLGRVESVYRTLVLGVRDYARKCGFKQAVLGLSGGIDSAVACCITVAALGPNNVLGVTMPSEYSSKGSVDDSRRLAANLGIRFLEIPIADVYHSYLRAVGPWLTAHSSQVADPGAVNLQSSVFVSLAEENIQARVRGNILMALSNKFGHLVITTGNKSELAVGYCTLYGDMSGGLAVLADVPKTMVYELARYINRERELIPRATIEKAPSAELRPNQTDQDTLPPYEILDEILARYLEQDQSVEEIVAAGLEKKTVEWVVTAVRKSEYKRRQAAPGIKVTTKAFGAGRRMPVAAKY
ncbi:MAG: NAD+ synthase [candidate division WOR-3 bacterium]